MSQSFTDLLNDKLHKLLEWIFATKDRQLETWKYFIFWLKVAESNRNQQMGFSFTNLFHFSLYFLQILLIIKLEKALLSPAWEEVALN